MSLSDRINKLYNIEIVTEVNCRVDNRKLGNKGGYTIWIDSTERNTPHQARVKIYPNHNMKGKYFNLKLYNMELKNSGSSLPDDVSLSDFNKLVEFLSRTAIREALLNVLCLPECKLSQDALSNAIRELSTKWSRLDEDNYKKDLAIIQKHAKMVDGVEYVPVPVDQILK